eukprot:scaffold205096_cov18-Tisochrysis_lutea.AAC.1
MEAIKGVWASKYNDRAYISLRKVRKGRLEPEQPEQGRFADCRWWEARRHADGLSLELPGGLFGNVPLN